VQKVLVEGLEVAFGEYILSSAQNHAMGGKVVKVQSFVKALYGSA
jgi:hypothetical protein